LSAAAVAVAAATAFMCARKTLMARRCIAADASTQEHTPRMPALHSHSACNCSVNKLGIKNEKKMNIETKKVRTTNNPRTQEHKPHMPALHSHSACNCSVRSCILIVKLLLLLQLECVKLHIDGEIFVRRVRRTQMNVTRAIALPS
jgi:hypothetical protein